MDGFEKQVLIGNIGAPIDHKLRPYISSLLNSIYQKTGNDIAQEIMRYSDFRIDGIVNISAVPKYPKYI